MDILLIKTNTATFATNDNELEINITTTNTTKI